MKTNTTEFIPEAVVVANGDFPFRPTPVHKLKSAPYVACCDGAANQYLDSGLVPDIIVGDSDSIDPQYRRLYASIIHHDPDQETNDQTKAIRFLQDKGFRKIAIVGATGMREDHTLGNISLLMEYQKMGLDVRMYTDYGVFIPAENDCSFTCPIGIQVSIFNFGTQGMTGEGLKYPIRDFQSWWEGTLNETTEGTFTIRCQGPYLVYIGEKK